MSGILRRLFRRSSLDAEIREEMEAHLAMRADLNQRSGMPADEAREAARRQFGNATAIRERLYEFNGFGWLDALVGDLAYAFRGLRRNPGLSLTAILTVAIGVGATASMFSIMRSLLLAPPPHVEAPDQVFRLHRLIPAADPGRPAADPPAASSVSSYPFYERVTQQATSVAGVAAYRAIELAVGAGADARMVSATAVSAGFWRTLGVQPALGRFIRDDEAHPATGARVVVLGHVLWRSRYGGRSDVIGQTLLVKGQPYEIVGVAPRGFRGVELADVDVWLPLFVVGDGTGRPVTWHTPQFLSSLGTVIVRVKPDVTLEQASSELTDIQRAFSVEVEGSRGGDLARLERLRRAQTLLGPLTGGLGSDLRPLPEVRVTVWLVGIAVVLVSIACSNVAGLLLLRAMRRRREIAVRLALGVSRRRLAQQLLTETSVLALLGGLTATVVVIWGGAWTQRTILPAMAWDPGSVVQPSVLVVSAVATLAAAIVAGMAPLWSVRPDLLSALRDGTLRNSPKRPRMQGVLLAVQGALAVVLLVGAGLFLRSLHNVETLDIGLDRDNVLVVAVDFSGTGRSEDDVTRFFERALVRVSELPGIAEASLAMTIPLRVARAGGWAYLPGRTEPVRRASGGSASMNAVTPGFFRTTGMRIVEGREFRETERTGEPVVIVNETMARLGWPGRSPVGELVCSSPMRQQICATVVGVVADAITFNLVGEEPRPYYYRPLVPDERESRALLVRMSPNVRRMDGTIRQALLELDAGLPYARIETLGEVLDPQIRHWRLGAAVFTAFGMLAIALAIVGLWSSVSYAVSQRTNEFAVRLAIGAKRTSLAALVLGDGLRNAVIAVAAGLTTAAAASGFIADLLFEVSPRDPAIFGAVAAGVLAVAAAASLLPAWRAIRIQPVDALRAE